MFESHLICFLSAIHSFPQFSSGCLIIHSWNYRALSEWGIRGLIEDTCKKMFLHVCNDWAVNVASGKDPAIARLWVQFPAGHTDTHTQGSTEAHAHAHPCIHRHAHTHSLQLPFSFAFYNCLCQKDACTPHSCIDKLFIFFSLDAGDSEAPPHMTAGQACALVLFQYLQGFFLSLHISVALGDFIHLFNHLRCGLAL